MKYCKYHKHIYPNERATFEHCEYRGEIEDVGEELTLKHTSYTSSNDDQEGIDERIMDAKLGAYGFKTVFRYPCSCKNPDDCPLYKLRVEEAHKSAEGCKKLLAYQLDLHLQHLRKTMKEGDITRSIDVKTYLDDLQKDLDSRDRESEKARQKLLAKVYDTNAIEEQEFGLTFYQYTHKHVYEATDDELNDYLQAVEKERTNRLIDGLVEHALKLQQAYDCTIKRVDLSQEIIDEFVKRYENAKNGNNV